MVDLVVIPGDELARVVAVNPASPPEGALAASTFGIQRINGVRSATSVMYQSFLAASQRAPSAFTASFSAKGVTRLILMGELSTAAALTGYPPLCLFCRPPCSRTQHRTSQPHHAHSAMEKAPLVLHKGASILVARGGIKQPTQGAHTLGLRPTISPPTTRH